MKRIFQISLVFILFLIMFTVLYTVENAKGDTIHVGSGQTYSTIQTAINDANESDTIYVHSGTYLEMIIIDKTLTLIGEGSSSTTISGSNDHTIKVTTNNVNISGFKIQNTGGSHYCVFLDTITGCEISNNYLRNGGHGIYLGSSDSNTISDNNIKDNNVGIYLSNSDSNTIISNNIQNNNANGIFLSSSSSGNTIYLNDFSSNMDSNAKDYGLNNWDYTLQGNYWDDYNGVDDNNDGKGDTPYIIPGGSNQDNYPLGYFAGGNLAPTANAGGPYTGQTNSEIEFDGSGSTDSDGNIVGYRWDWTNDGTYETGWLSKSTTTNIYSQAGTYTVKLQVKDNDGATDTDISQVTIIFVNQKPNAFILKPTIPTADYGKNVTFEGYGADTDGTVVEYLWWSDPEEIYNENVTFIKNDIPVGQYTIYFKVKDDNGDWSSEVSTTLTILSDAPDNQAPIADAGGSYTGYVNRTVTFDGSGSYDPDNGDIISYYWDFGDGSVGEGISPTHIYNSEGNYTVQLTVIDNHGEQSKSSTNVKITFKVEDQNNDKEDNRKIPGFETVIVIVALTILVFWKRKRF